MLGPSGVLSAMRMLTLPVLVDQKMLSLVDIHYNRSWY